MDRWAPREPSRRGPMAVDSDYSEANFRGRDPRDPRDDDRRRPDYAEREGYRPRSGGHRPYSDRDNGRHGGYHDGYHDGHHDSHHDGYSSRYGRDNYYSRRDRSASPLRYSDDSPPGRRRSISPDPYRRRRSSDSGTSPNIELKLSGLPKDDAHAISQDTIKEQIESMAKVTLSSVRIISDHSTGLPKGFGFITFPALDDAVKFHDNNKSGIILYGDNADKYYVDIAYALHKSRDLRNQTEPEWLCACGMQNRATRMICFRTDCNAPKESAVSTRRPGSQNHGNSSSPVAFGKPGESDRSLDGSASQFLLVLGLSQRVNTSMLAKGVAKLCGGVDEDESPAPGQPTKTTNPSTRTNATADVVVGARPGSIKRVFLVKDKKTSESRRYGFIEFHTVDDAVKALAQFNTEDRFTIASDEVDIAHPHNGIFKPADPSVDYSVELAIPGQRMVYWQSSAYIVEEWIQRDPPAAEEKAKDERPAQTSGIENGKSAALVAKKLAKKRKAEEIEPIREPTTTMKSRFGTWNKAKEELHDEPDLPKVAEQSFIHMEKLCCLLCHQKFKTEKAVLKHEKESDMHRSNLLSADCIKKGYERLVKAKVIEQIPEDWVAIANVSTSGPTEPYLDRAKMRRNETRQVKEEQKAEQRAEQKISFSLGPKQTASKQTEPAAEPVAETKGLAMMRKMGYAGSGGLGADGQGSASAVPVSMYAAGVGLGAEGGMIGDAVEEAGRNTRNNRDEYLDKVKDKAKERFLRM